MTIDQLTDLAWEVTDELEPSHSFDVFDVTEAQIIFQSEHGLKKVRLSCIESNQSLKEYLRISLSSL